MKTSVRRTGGITTTVEYEIPGRTAVRRLIAIAKGDAAKRMSCWISAQGKIASVKPYFLEHIALSVSRPIMLMKFGEAS